MKKITELSQRSYLYKVTLIDIDKKTETEYYYTVEDIPTLIKYLDLWQHEIYRTTKFIYKNIEYINYVTIIIEKP